MIPSYKHLLTAPVCFCLVRFHAAASSLVALFRASMALTEFSNALFKTRLPMVLSTRPSSRPLKFLPWRTTTTSMSVEDDAVGIRPVVLQMFPDAARAFGDVSLRPAVVMHLEVLISAVAKKFRAARPKVGEPGDELLGRQRGSLVEVDFRDVVDDAHCRSSSC